MGRDLFAGDPSPNDVMPKARDAAQKALQLDDGLAEAHTTLALVQMNWVSAEREFKRAIELNPSYSPAHVWYAHFLAAMGRFDESVSQVKRAQELDPFSEFTVDFGAWALYFSQKYDLAVEAEGPRKSSQWARYNRAMIYEAQGQIDDAVQEYLKAEELFGIRPERLVELRKSYRESGPKGYWTTILKSCREGISHPRKFASTTGYGWCDYWQDGDMASVQVRLHDYDGALESLERNFAKHGYGLIYLNIDPWFNDIRSDPRIKDLVRRVGLPQ